MINIPMTALICEIIMIVDMKYTDKYINFLLCNLLYKKRHNIRAWLQIEATKP